MHTHELLALSATIVPERVATLFHGHKTTFAQLASRANRLANALAPEGVGAGERVAMLDVNTPHHLEWYFAAARLDALYVPLNFRGGDEELLTLLKTAAPRVLAAGKRYVPLVERVRLSVPSLKLTVVVDGADREGWLGYESLLDRGADEELHFPHGGDSDPAVLLFTAGTTGGPKGVVLPHASLTSYLLANVTPADPEVEERTLLTVPLYHVAGLQAALASIYGGRTLVVQRQFEPGEWLELAERESVQRALLVPTMLKQLLDHPDFTRRDLSSLQVIAYGGAPAPVPLVQRAVRALPHCQFINAFGQTETGSTITMLPPEDHILEGPPEVVERRRRRLGSIGRPLPEVEVQIVDDAGTPVAPGRVGEIVARGPRLMAGYWGQEAETAQVLRDGWLHTGDLAYQDADGYIYLAGRARDFIKRGGEMVSPEEVEQVLEAHPRVAEAAVIGVADETWGQLVLAVVVPQPGARVTQAQLLEHCRGRLARFKRPESVSFVEELPRNAMGKVLKRELRERYGG